MGKKELRERSGDRVIFNNTRIEFEQEEISKDEVYKMLKSEPIRWNFDNLRTIRPSPIPESKHTEESLMEVWNSIYVRKWGESDHEKAESIIICENADILIAVYGNSVKKLIEDVKGNDILRILSRALGNRSKDKKNKSIARILALLVKNRDQCTLSWNVLKLKREEDKAKFKKMWNESKDMIILSSNKWTIEGFIHHIYNPTEKYRRWRIIDGNNYKDPDNHPSIVMVKNLLRNILGILLDRDEDTVVSSINMICEGLEYCPDKQISDMKDTYRGLTGEIENVNMDDNLDGLVRSVIGMEKESVFGYVVTPSKAGQNVHVLNVLTNMMADEFGVNRTIKTVFGTMGLDRFNGWPGNILQAFYSSFIPEYMYKVLKEHINRETDMRCEALKRIYEKKGMSYGKKLKMGIVVEPVMKRAKRSL